MASADQTDEEPRQEKRWPARRIAKVGGLLVLGFFVFIQLIPYGRTHSNPPVTQAAKWSDPAAQKIAETSCYDCHSNLTSWPWYSNVAPVSWLVMHDVEEGRGRLNFSEWDRQQPELGEFDGVVTSGAMPPSKYTLIHTGTKLSQSQKATLLAGIEKLYRSDPPGRTGGG